VELGVRESYRRVRGGVAALSLRGAIRGVADTYEKHDLAVLASAIAFRLFLALIPCLLFLLGLVGFLGLDEVWQDDIVPELRPAVSAAAFMLINDAVTYVLSQQQAFWCTIGAAIAIWQLSSIVRATGEVLNRIYGVEESEERPLLHRFAVSYGIAAVVGVLILLAIAVLRLGPVVIDDVLPDSYFFQALAFAVRWLVGAALLLMAIGFIVRAGPDREEAAHWVTSGALLVVVGWAAFSALFGLYLTQVASYATIFGNLATIFVAGEYLFLSANVFIAGLVLNRLVENAQASRDGETVYRGRS
jgi:membrane protein